MKEGMGQVPVSGWGEDPTPGPTLARLRRISASSDTSSGEESPDVRGGGRLRAWIRVGMDWVPGDWVPQAPQGGPEPGEGGGLAWAGS